MSCTSTKYLQLRALAGEASDATGDASGRRQHELGAPGGVDDGEELGGARDLLGGRREARGLVEELLEDARALPLLVKGTRWPLARLEGRVVQA